ncbi:hypothetical protein EHN65_00645 [Salmonella enterica]|nr:hypothetical protein [Salmonella enterica]
MRLHHFTLVAEDPVPILTSVFLPLNTFAHDYHLKKMPTEVGELEAMRVPSLAGVTGFAAQRHRNGALL